ncbi:MAG: deaminase [Candidatus Paceibacterota bacterium]
MKKTLLLYIPVVHNGYIQLFKKWKPHVTSLYIVGTQFCKEFAYFEEEIRAVDPALIKIMVESLDMFPSVEILTEENLARLSEVEVITTQEGVMQRFLAKYFPEARVTFDTVFLRWDEQHVSQRVNVTYDKVSEDRFDKEIMRHACHEGEKTSDWWRRVGAVVVKDGKITYSAHNHHLPSDHTPYSLGDIRDFVEAGTHPEASSSLHAEKSIIVEAAKGVLEGSDIYLSVFPCADCAKIIAETGFKRCFFQGGQAYFDGEQILRAHNIEIIFVPFE